MMEDIEPHFYSYTCLFHSRDENQASIARGDLSDSQRVVLVESTILAMAMSMCPFHRLPYLASHNLHDGWMGARFLGDLDETYVSGVIDGLVDRQWLRPVTQDDAMKIVEDRQRIFGDSLFSSSSLVKCALVSPEAAEFVCRESAGETFGGLRVEHYCGYEVLWRPERFDIHDLPVEYQGLSGVTSGGEPIGVVQEVGPWVSYPERICSHGWRFIAPLRKEVDFWDCNFPTTTFSGRKVVSDITFSFAYET